MYVPVVECDVTVVETVRLSHLNAVKQMSDLIDVRSVCARLAKRAARLTYVCACINDNLNYWVLVRLHTRVV